MTTIKTQIVFPQDVLEELDGLVKDRQRSDFVVEAVREKLQRLRLEQTMQRTAGIWSKHEQLKTNGQVQKFLKKLRGGDTRRQKRLQKAWKNG